MGLSTQLASQVPDSTRQRGRQYFQRGVVRLRHGDAESVEATVRGTETYSVSIFHEGHALVSACTCPFFAEYGQVCKHIWATVLAAEPRGFLQRAGQAPPRFLLVDEDALDEEPDVGLNGSGPGPWDRRDRDRGTSHVPAPAPRNGRGRPSGRGRRRSPRKTKANWKKSLSGLRTKMQQGNGPAASPWPAGYQVLYVVDVPGTLQGQGLVVDVVNRHRKRNGEWSKLKSQGVRLSQVSQLPDPEDREIISLLNGSQQSNPHYPTYGYSYYDATPVRYRLSEALRHVLLPRMCRTGRCRLRLTAEEADPRGLRWDDGPAWEFWLAVAPDGSGKTYRLAGQLRRGDERIDLAAPHLLLAGGLVFWEDRVALLDDGGAFDWITFFRQNGVLSVPAKQRDDLLKELLALPRLPRLDLPDDLSFEEVTVKPRPRLKVRPPDRHPWGQPRLRGELSFDYDGEVIAADQPGRGIYQPERRRLMRRDTAAEAAAAERLKEVGFQTAAAYYYSKPELQLAPRHLPRVVRTLLDDGWHVEAEGKVYRHPGNFHIDVTSGIDWFELHGFVDFGDTTAHLPELLAALRRGEDMVRLGDGSFGLLPEEWLKKYGQIAGLGKVEGDHLRFSRTQVGLLDAFLASQPGATFDETFARARGQLLGFEGITAVEPPAGFVGRLRGYQKEGLGWLSFLQEFGFGGCLADDMGLGKTVQVLALLESRRALRADTAKDRPGPSLVVVPRSLIFNWKQEAARFTPELRVLDHTGIHRGKPGAHFQDHDLILTTYGTLRRDALHFKDCLFDYVILDEAQAIKNATSESAKAARLLRAGHRLALSGTPIENHLGELWSLFEFLNPGMLGSAAVFQMAGGAARNPGEETRSLLARALRPFILRRTKKQVASDLPEKTEQTIYCELEAAQRKQYDELRRHYRDSLLARIDKDGLNRSKIQILEALLRLRQAACHPGLIDKERLDESSAKLDNLLPQVAEVIEEDHKVLVFSQFTSFLAIVRDRLDAEKIPYEYLDGRTRDRASRVERFQNDPDCKLFLISLKAGGLGLNLTAAEYVFLLDPWWNPAVEAQAIDRAHRIGQTRQVFAYRLIAKDTVEEKVLELQKTKRELADAIINADNSLIRSLGREDLELLLS